MPVSNEVEKVTNPLKNPRLSRMDDDLNARNSAPRLAHCIHWRMVTGDWRLAYCKKAGIIPLASSVLYGVGWEANISMYGVGKEASSAL